MREQVREIQSVPYLWQGVLAPAHCLQTTASPNKTSLWLSANALGVLSRLCPRIRPEHKVSPTGMLNRRVVISVAPSKVRTRLMIKHRDLGYSQRLIPALKNVGLTFGALFVLVSCSSPRWDGLYTHANPQNSSAWLIVGEAAALSQGGNTARSFSLEKDGNKAMLWTAGVSVGSLTLKGNDLEWCYKSTCQKYLRNADYESAGQ